MSINNKDAKTKGIKENYFIDSHCHIVPDVDDGCKNLEEAIELIKSEIDNGIKTIFCTPHFRRGMFEVDNNLIENNFLALQNEVKRLGLDVDLYLGREIYINSLSGGFERAINRIKDGTVKGYNNKNTVLFEFSYTHEIDISEISYNTINLGYTPVIAHIERYEYIDSIDKVLDIKESGGIIQVNASSIVGADGIKTKKFVKKLLKNKLVDVIASDLHMNRNNYYKNAYNYIKKKYGEEYANQLCYSNPKEFILNK